MVNILNRKRLLVDTSQVECNRVKQLLKQNNIEFYYKTAKSAPMASVRSDVSAGSNYALPYSMTEKNINFVYYIFVRRKDYQTAKEILRNDSINNN